MTKEQELSKYKAWQLRKIAQKHNKEIRGGKAKDYLPALHKKKKAEIVSFLAKNYRLHAQQNGHKLKSRHMEHSLVRNAARPARRRRAPAPQAAPRAASPVQEISESPPPSPPRRPPRAPDPVLAAIKKDAERISFGDVLFATDGYQKQMPATKLSASYQKATTRIKRNLARAIMRKDQTEIKKNKFLLAKMRTSYERARKASKPPRSAQAKKILAEELKIHYNKKRGDTWDRIREFLYG